MANLFKSPKVQYTPPGFNAGGINSNFIGGGGGGGNYQVTTDPVRTDLVSNLSGAGAEAAGTFGNLFNTVGPGFNDLLRARLNTFNDSATKAIGDLRENLSSRRVLGSSFGQDTIARANNEFARGRDSIVADNFLKSLAAQEELTMQKYNATKQQYQAGLDELNLEADTAKGLTSTASAALAANAQLNAKLQQDTNAGIGKLIGTGIGLAAAPFTGGLSLLPSLGSGLGSMFGGNVAAQYGANPAVAGGGYYGTGGAVYPGPGYF